MSQEKTSSKRDIIWIAIFVVIAILVVVLGSTGTRETIDSLFPDRQTNHNPNNPQFSGEEIEYQIETNHQLTDPIIFGGTLMVLIIIGGTIIVLIRSRKDQSLLSRQSDISSSEEGKKDS